MPDRTAEILELIRRSPSTLNTTMFPQQQISPEEASGITDGILNPTPAPPAQPNDNMLQLVQPQQDFDMQRDYGQPTQPAQPPINVQEYPPLDQRSNPLTEIIPPAQDPAPVVPPNQPDPLMQLLQNRPQRDDYETNPWMNRLAGFFTGWSGGPSAGIAASQNRADRPYNQAMQDWGIDLNAAFQQQSAEQAAQQQLLDFIISQGQLESEAADRGVTQQGNILGYLGTDLTSGRDREVGLGRTAATRAVGMDRNAATREGAQLRADSFDDYNSIRRDANQQDFILGLLRAATGGGGSGGQVDPAQRAEDIMLNYNRLYGNDRFPPDPNTGIIGFGDPGGGVDFLGRPEAYDHIIGGAQGEIGNLLNQMTGQQGQQGGVHPIVNQIIMQLLAQSSAP